MMARERESALRDPEDKIQARRREEIRAAVYERRRGTVGALTAGKCALLRGIVSRVVARRYVTAILRACAFIDVTRYGGALCCARAALRATITPVDIVLSRVCYAMRNKRRARRYVACADTCAR